MHLGSSRPPPRHALGIADMRVSAIAWPAQTNLAWLHLQALISTISLSILCACCQTTWPLGAREGRTSALDRAPEATVSRHRGGHRPVKLFVTHCALWPRRKAGRVAGISEHVRTNRRPENFTPSSRVDITVIELDCVLESAPTHTCTHRTRVDPHCDTFARALPSQALTSYNTRC